MYFSAHLSVTVVLYISALGFHVLVPTRVPKLPEDSTRRCGGLVKRGGGESWLRSCSERFGPESDMEFTVKPKQGGGGTGDRPGE